MRGAIRISAALAAAVAVAGAGSIVHAAEVKGPTLYGQLNVSLDHLDNGADSALNVSSNRSRIGVKGDIPIQDGLKAIYQVESEFRADSANAGTLASRNTFVGLAGGFGTVRAGRFDTPVKLLGRKVELFGNQVGDFRNLTRAGSAFRAATAATGTAPASPAVAANRFDERPNNSIGYDSPNFGGASFSLQYATNPDDGVTATNDYDTLSAALNYASGPLYVGVGYEQNGNAAPGQDDPNAVRIAGYYDLGAVRLTALWQSISANLEQNDEDVYGVGIRYKHDSAWALKAQWYQLSADRADADATLAAIGAEYALAKPVTLYLDYAIADNDDNRGTTPYREGRGDNLAIAANGEKGSALSFGAIYRF
ncbi:MAG: porin [Gammaproteobacteria bacterium]|jgi:predicted porin|nr:porin [Gammaproteobacteria bacterium]